MSQSKTDTQTYGGATIVPLRSRNELRVQLPTGEKAYYSPEEARDQAAWLRGASASDPLVAVDQPDAIADGLEAEADRL